jgi:hypothetical protein
MDARFTRQGITAVLVVLVLAAGAALATRSAGKAASVLPADTARISDEQRAAGPRFDAGVAPADRAWIEAAIAAARPEAKPLVGVVDGLVEFRTVVGGDPLGLTSSTFRGDQASFRIDLNIAELDGRRVQDRNVVVLHELGHVIDHALVPQPLNDRLDAMIPRSGSCGQTSTGLTGSCTEPAERFADTFAKWALRGAVSAVGAGYGVANPPSLEDWGAPLVPLATDGGS